MHGFGSLSKGCSSSCSLTGGARLGNIGALIVRIGFWGPFYYIYNKEP